MIFNMQLRGLFAYHVLKGFVWRIQFIPQWRLRWQLRRHWKSIRPIRTHGCGTRRERCTLGWKTICDPPLKSHSHWILDEQNLKAIRTLQTYMYTASQKCYKTTQNQAGQGRTLKLFLCPWHFVHQFWTISNKMELLEELQTKNFHFYCRCTKCPRI